MMRKCENMLNNINLRYAAALILCLLLCAALRDNCAVANNAGDCVCWRNMLPRAARVHGGGDDVMAGEMARWAGVCCSDGGVVC